MRCLFVLVLLQQLLFLLPTAATAAEIIRCPIGWGGSLKETRIPDSLINDNYCDCPTTGADEPDTGACAGSQESWAGVLRPQADL
jgi:hypothetical protein